jgi:hypothetical protein
MNINCLPTTNDASVRFYRVPTVTMTFGFYIFPLDNISSKTTRTAFFIAKINKMFKIIICIHHNLEVSLLLLLQRTEIICAALFVIPHLDQPLKGFEIEHWPPTNKIR